MDYQKLKKARELKRDMEKILLQNNAKVAGTDTVARELAGLPAWLITNVSKNGSTDPTGDGTDARSGGTPRAFTEDQLKTVAGECYDEGGNPGILLVGRYNRQIASSFGAGTKMQKVEDKTLHTSFDVYESDFSNLKIVPDRFTSVDNAFLLDMEYWKIPFIDNMLSTPMAKTGDSDQHQILSEFTLEACNEKASGIVADLTSS